MAPSAMERNCIHPLKISNFDHACAACTHHTEVRVREYGSADTVTEIRNEGKLTVPHAHAETRLEQNQHGTERVRRANIARRNENSNFLLTCTVIVCMCDGVMV